MYKIKYYLWLIGLALCLSLDAYSADHPNTTSFDNSNSCDISITGEDCDGDGLTNGEETTGIDNATTVAVPTGSTDPNNPCDPPGMYVDTDCDGDGLTNNEELTLIDDSNTSLEPTDKSNPDDPCDPPGLPVNVDCDMDGLTNYEEVNNVDDPSTPSSPVMVSDPTVPCDGNNVINNSCANAYSLTLNQCDAYFNVCGGDAEENTCENDKSSVWYHFTPAQTGEYKFEINDATFNDVLTLFETQTDCSNLSELICINNDEFGFVGEHVYHQLQVGTDYYIMVSGADCTFGGLEGAFCIKITQESNSATIPTNEECDASLPTINLTANSEECVTGSNLYASNADPQPSCSPYAGASVWYKIQTPSSSVGKIQISAAANYSEVITVYEGTCGSLTEKACKLNGADNADDLIVNDLSGSTVYYIQVSGNFATIEADNGETCSGESYIIISTDFTCPPSGELCNDYNPNTINDEWDGNCNCAGDCANNEGDICDDGREETEDDTFDEYCNCVGNCLLTVANDCPNTNYNINNNCECDCLLVGTPCNDGDANTSGDTWNSSCVCTGTPDGSGGDCEVDITITGPSASSLHEASNSITSNGTVAVTPNLELNAGVYINLKPGFSSTGGAELHGYIDGCEPSSEKVEQQTASASVKHYPNPFNNEINLEFTLDFDAEVQIIISDVNGRTITHLPAQNIYTGTQTINVSTEHWIAGVYFYQAFIKQQNAGILTRATGTIVKL